MISKTTQKYINSVSSPSFPPFLLFSESSLLSDHNIIIRMESLTPPADQISIQDLIQLLVSTTSKLKLETCSNKIEELHGKQEYDEVERSDGEYLEEGYVLVDRDPQTKTQRRVDRAAATENANKKHPELNIHQRLPIIEAQIRPKASSPPTAQIPHKPNAHQALPIVETPIQAQPARATRPPGLERSPLSEAQKIEVVMLEIDAEVVSNKKDGDCQIWANLSASDRELWSTWPLIYHFPRHMLPVTIFFGCSVE